MPTPELEVDTKKQEMILWFRGPQWTLEEKARVANEDCNACPLRSWAVLANLTRGRSALLCETLHPAWSEAAILRAELLPDRELKSHDLLPDDEATVRATAVCLQRKQ